MASENNEMRLFFEMIAGKMCRSEELTFEEKDKLSSYKGQVLIFEEETLSDEDWARFWAESEVGVETDEEFKIRKNTIAYKRELKGARFLRRMKRRYSW